MSRAAAINFLRAVQADKRLQSEIAAAATAKGEVALDAVLELAASWGLEVTREDWRSLQDDGGNTGTVLSESDLEFVAGGGGEAGRWGLSSAGALVLPDGTALVVAGSRLRWGGSLGLRNIVPELTLQDLGWLLVIGKVLSALSLALLLAALIDARRRAAFPEVAYGGLSLSVARVRVLWIGILLASAILGVGSDPLANSSVVMEDAEDEVGQVREGRTVTSSLAVPLPFYRYVVTRTHVGGHLVREEVTESFLIPKAFLVTLLAYWVLVVRWNPESRLALRILNGRKRG